MLSSIGPYRVDSLLGRSALSAVYAVTDTRNQRQVALRLFDERLSRKRTFIDDLNDLVCALRRVDHARVLTYLEAGEASEGCFLSSEIAPGGDCQALLRRNGGVLELPQAMQLFKESCEALGALDAMGLRHHNIRPSALMLDLHGGACLASSGLVPLLERSRGSRTTLANLSYCAPEVAAGLDGADVRADIYSLGATLFRLLSGTLLFDDPDPITLLHKVREGQLPDLEQALPQVPESVRAFILRCCARRPDRRFGSPLAVLDAVESLNREILASRRAGAAIDALDALGSDRQALRAAIDASQLRRLTQMIRVENDGLLAIMRLAPGACFKRGILELILVEAGVRYGIDFAALTEATRPLDMVRQVIIARGDPAAPGCNGCNVYGDPIPPPMTTVVIRVAEDASEALALVQPGRPILAEDLELALKQAQLRHGIIDEALRSLRSGRGLEQPTLLLARATPMRPAQDAGWELQRPQGDMPGPPLVRRGDKVAVWRAAEKGEDGIDVYGETIVAAPPRSGSPQDYCGEGVNCSLERGQPMLIATCDGAVLQRSNGRVEVRAVLDIDGDIDGNRPPIDSDSVVIVRGSVCEGAVLQSSSDIVIIGDINGGEISAGGDIEIGGAISGDGPALNAGGELRAHDIAGRSLIAGSLRVSGSLRSARIHVTGDVQASSIVGGEIVCGGSIEADVLGDSEGTTTVARCGSHLKLAQRQMVARLRWQKVNADRRHLLSSRDDLLAEQEAIEQRSMRHRSSSISCAEALAMMHKEIAKIDERLALVHQEAENLRQEVLEQFEAVEEVNVVRDKARILARRMAYSGVKASIADNDPEELRRDRRRYRLELS